MLFADALAFLSSINAGFLKLWSTYSQDNWTALSGAGSYRL